MTQYLTRCWLTGLGALLLAALMAVPADAQSPAESIYRLGILPSGESLTATREPDMTISGAAAACGNCHRRSGLGELDGHIGIPPISGPYLFHRSTHSRDDFDLPRVEAARFDREPYTDSTLARAIRTGIASDGHPLSYLMPHYSLDDTDMAALIGYLKGLAPAKSPGVTDSVLNFATIITPDADPVKRRGVLDVLEHFFAEQNAVARRQSPPLGSAHNMHFNPIRQWRLHVWQLSGPASGWDRQLHEYLAQQPVLAVLSGLGGRNWAPVHRFCEQAALPCLFPNVELPTVAEHDFYSLYFSRGVLLEADLIARRLTQDAKAAAARRVVQIFRPADIGQPAARAVRSGAPELQIVDRPLAAGAAGPQLSAALQDLDARDVLILWLRPADLSSLASLPAGRARVVISGLMGGLGETPLPAAWRGATQMAYPFDLPERRRVRMDYALGWFRMSQIVVVAEQVQADTWVACTALSETLSHMGGALSPDYLVERMEGMLEQRILTAYYPRLSLAPNQRFASKGGYLVRFASATGSRVVPDSDWIVP